jgi:hypothetical protein
MERAIACFDAYLNVPESRQLKEDWRLWLKQQTQQPYGDQ